MSQDCPDAAISYPLCMPNRKAAAELKQMIALLHCENKQRVVEKDSTVLFDMLLKAFKQFFLKLRHGFRKLIEREKS